MGQLRAPNSTQIRLTDIAHAANGGRKGRILKRLLHLTSLEVVCFPGEEQDPKPKGQPSIAELAVRARRQHRDSRKTKLPTQITTVPGRGPVTLRASELSLQSSVGQGLSERAPTSAPSLRLLATHLCSP